VEQSGSSPGS